MRSSWNTSSPPTLQVGRGRGEAVNGTVMVNGSPAITVMSRIVRSDVIFGAPAAQTDGRCVRRAWRWCAAQYGYDSVRSFQETELLG